MRVGTRLDGVTGRGWGQTLVQLFVTIIIGITHFAVGCNETSESRVYMIIDNIVIDMRTRNALQTSGDNYHTHGIPLVENFDVNKNTSNVNLDTRMDLPSFTLVYKVQ